MSATATGDKPCTVASGEHDLDNLGEEAESSCASRRESEAPARDPLSYLLLRVGGDWRLWRLHHSVEHITPITVPQKVTWSLR